MQTHQQKATSGTETLGLLLHCAGGQEIRRHLEVTLATIQSLLFSPTKGLERARQWCPRITSSGPAQDHVGTFKGMLMPAMQMQTLHKATASTCTSQSSGFQGSVNFNSTLHKHIEPTQYSGTGPLKHCCRRTERQCGGFGHRQGMLAAPSRASAELHRLTLLGLSRTTLSCEVPAEHSWASPPQVSSHLITQFINP